MAQHRVNPVYHHLPPPGAHVLTSHVIASSGLPCAVAWGNLAILCCEGKATVAVLG